MRAWLTALSAIVTRENLRFVRQRGRFLAALVRPLVWLVVFAAGFRAALGLSIIPPYQTYITYELYILPGLCGMIQLFNGMQSSLSLVYDQEMGSMRLLLTSPLPRWWLLFSKLLAGVIVSILQVAVFLGIAALTGITVPAVGYIAVLPALLLSGLMLGALGLLISSTVRQLENFADVMNFVIFPMFFLSSALMEDGGKLAALARHLCRESVHPCGRTDTLCALRRASSNGARRGLHQLRAVHAGCAVGL